MAELERQRLELEATLRRCQEAIIQDRDDLRQRLVGSLDVRGLRLGAGASLHMVRKGRQAVRALAVLHRRLAEARGVLVEAMRGRRALELLEERRRALWKRALDRAETAALDELAQRRPLPCPTPPAASPRCAPSGTP